jgi:hypothetical protein
VVESVKLVEGKFVKTGKEDKPNGERPRRYIYPKVQYDNLLRIAKSDGLEVGDTLGKNTHAVRQMTELIIDAFIAERGKPAKAAAKITPPPSK